MVSKLHWWLQALDSKPPIPIPFHPLALDLCAFSDASTSHGLAIVIGDRWRAWKLHDHWKCDGRDIGWAEGIAFKLLIRTLLTINHSSTPLAVYCDNQGIVDGWKKGQSRNAPTNAAFRRVHTLLASPLRQIFTRYVPSADNPADPLSHSQYPPTSWLLPWIPIPEEIRNLVLDFDDPICAQLHL